MNPVAYFLKLIVIIFGTLFALRILFILVNRVPGVVVALSLIAIMSFSIAYYKGGFRAIGIRSRKASVIAIIAATLLFIISTGILMNIH
ncbi:MAG: hypothetical protein WD424_09100 [Paenibacillaceae bacterium]